MRHNCSGIDPLQTPCFSDSVVLQNTHVLEVHGESGGSAVGALEGIGVFSKSCHGVERRVWRNASEVQAASLNFTAHEESSWLGQRIALRSEAIALEAEKRNGIPKLDSDWIVSRFEFTKDGGGEH